MTAGTRRAPRRGSKPIDPKPVLEQPVIAIETDEALYAIWAQRQGAGRSADDAAANANRHATEAHRQRAEAARQITDAQAKRREAEIALTEAERLEKEAATNEEAAASNERGAEHYRQQEALHRAVARDLHNAVRGLAHTPAHKELLKRLEEQEAQVLANGTVGQSLTVPPTGGDPLQTKPFAAVDALEATLGRDGGL